MLALGRSVEMPRAPQRAASRSARWTTRRVLIGITGVAVLLRLAVAIALGDTANEVSGAADQFSYDVLAQRVLQGYGFSFPTAWYPFALANTPTAHWSYAYTLYLAAVYGIAGHHPLIARLIQALASGAGCWLIFRIGRRLFDDRVGLTAAALTAVYAYFVFFNAALMTQTFFILALLAAIDRALAIAERPTLGTWAALGACLGVGVLLRQTLLLYIPLLLGWLVWVTYGRLRLRDLIVAIVVVTLFIAPWTLRNYVAFGDFLLLNSNGGYFLWASNHPNQGTSFDPVHIAPVPAALQGAPEPVIDRALFRAAAGFIADDPIRFVRLSVSRAGSYFWLLPARSSPPLSNLARLGSFTLYFPFMLYGLVLSRARWRMCLPLYLYVGVDAVLHLGSWAAPRYRLPSDALLMVFAGLAVVDLARRLRRPAIGEPRAAKLVRAVAIAGAAATCVAPSARALDAGRWSPPHEIFRGVGRTVSPLLVSDQSGDVHLFFVTGAGPSEADTLMYARRPADGEWSAPVPLPPPSPGHHIEFPAITLDRQGWLHIVYQGPHYNHPEYQHVHLSRITDPHEWSHSTTLSSSGVFSSQIAAAPDGRLHVVYATPRDGIVYRSSDDRGRSWSDEVSVSATDTKGQGWNLPSLDVDARGRLHLAWTQYALPTAWPPTGVFYTRSLDNGETWAAPRQIAARDNGEATLLASADAVDLAWNGIDSGARMYASSNDGGATWSAPQPLDDELRGGNTGPPHLAIDAADKLHLLTAVNRSAGGEEIASLGWDGSVWSAPERLSVDDTARSIRQPAVAVVDGNHLYAAFHVDERAIFVTDMRVDAPTLTRRPVPTMTSGWRARIAGSSLRLRIVVAVLAFLALEAAAEYGWRTWRRSRR
jgi:4-amino-4-deoxy-L-arabinose transferase-like glycosyltransferase